MQSHTERERESMGSTEGFLLILRVLRRECRRGSMVAVMLLLSAATFAAIVAMQLFFYSGQAANR